MSENKQKIAEILLDIEAVILKPAAPFTLSSGLKSPVYCDNRLLLSHPSQRKKTSEAFSETIAEVFPEAEVLAGTATAGIPHAAWAAELMELPMVYVRGSKKKHGKQKQIEGRLLEGQKVVVIEDLISTGGSVLQAVAALREAGAVVLGVVSIFSYLLPQAKQAFEENEVRSVSLTDIFSLIDAALAEKIIDEDQADILKAWQRDPAGEAWLELASQGHDNQK